MAEKKKEFTLLRDETEIKRLCAILSVRFAYTEIALSNDVVEKVQAVCDLAKRSPLTLGAHCFGRTDN